MGHIGHSSYHVSKKSIQQILRSDVERMDGQTDGHTDRVDSKIPLRNEMKWNNKHLRTDHVAIL